MKALNLIGKKFGIMTILGPAAKNRQGYTSWLCQCECGNTKTYSTNHLTRKTYPVKSCGCQMIKRGPNHIQWNGHGEISGGWWHTHVTRERTQTRRAQIPVTVTIEQAWDLFIKQNKKCALSGLPLTISGTSRYNTASIDRIDSSRRIRIR